MPLLLRKEVGMWVLKHTKSGGQKYQLEGLILSHALTRMTAPSAEGAF